MFFDINICYMGEGRSLFFFLSGFSFFLIICSFFFEGILVKIFFFRDLRKFLGYFSVFYGCKLLVVFICLFLNLVLGVGKFLYKGGDI